MTLEQWAALAAYGALFGLIGQALRTAMGLRKLHQEQATTPGGFDAAFSTKQIVISLLLGGLAGIMAAITLLGVPGNADLEAYKTGGAISASFITSIIAAGYAGGDFLEGIIKSHLKPSQG